MFCGEKTAPQKKSTKAEESFGGKTIKFYLNRFSHLFLYSSFGNNSSRRRGMSAFRKQREKLQTKRLLLLSKGEMSEEFSPRIVWCGEPRGTFVLENEGHSRGAFNRRLERCCEVLLIRRSFVRGFTHETVESFKCLSLQYAHSKSS